MNQVCIDWFYTISTPLKIFNEAINCKVLNSMACHVILVKSWGRVKMHVWHEVCSDCHLFQCIYSSFPSAPWLFFTSYVNFSGTHLPFPSVSTEKLFILFLIYFFPLKILYLQTMYLNHILHSLPALSRTTNHIVLQVHVFSLLICFSYFNLQSPLTLTIYLWVWGQPLRHGQPSSVHTPKKKWLFLSPETINCQRTSELGIEPKKSLPNSSHYFFNPHMIRTLWKFISSYYISKDSL